MLKFALLGILSDGPSHGYHVKAQFEDLFAGTWPINIGQVYTTLQRLERDGLIAGHGDRGNRGKREYILTEAGHNALAIWLGTPQSEVGHLREEIYLKLLFTKGLSNGGWEALLKDQRQVYLKRLEELSQTERAARSSGRADLILLVRGAIAHVQADLAWVDACVEQFRPQQDTLIRHQDTEVRDSGQPD